MRGRFWDGVERMHINGINSMREFFAQKDGPVHRARTRKDGYGSGRIRPRVQMHARVHSWARCNGRQRLHHTFIAQVPSSFQFNKNNRKLYHTGKPAAIVPPSATVSTFPRGNLPRRLIGFDKIGYRRGRSRGRDIFGGIAQ